uniref:Uncharacterized protein n=1 Tax=Strigamia maritima TaxID=126957 RepID=T1ILT4_STRMM
MTSVSACARRANSTLGVSVIWNAASQDQGHIASRRNTNEQDFASFLFFIFNVYYAKSGRPLFIKSAKPRQKARPGRWGRQNEGEKRNCEIKEKCRKWLGMGEKNEVKKKLRRKAKNERKTKRMAGNERENGES